MAITTLPCATELVYRFDTGMETKDCTDLSNKSSYSYLLSLIASYLNVFTPFIANRNLRINDDTNR